MNENDRFEFLAAAFHRETGLMAPGKDWPLPTASHEERWEKWREWLAGDAGRHAADSYAAAKIRETCMTYDNERDHADADEILCELLLSLGYNETVKAWQAVSKWYA